MRAWLYDVGIEGSGASVARAVGLDRKHVWDWLTGRKVPNGRMALRLARALGVSADSVLVACLRAEERRLAALAALRAREEADK